MSPEIKKQYAEVLEELERQTLVEEVGLTEMTEREKLWYRVGPAIYVIGKSFELFDKVAVDQGFSRLLNRVRVKNLGEVNPGNELKNWFSPSTCLGMDLPVAGCHMSHGIVAKHFLKSGKERVLVFENDCAFTSLLSDEFLTELASWCDNSEIGFLNLGTTEYTPAHSYFGQSYYTNDVKYSGDKFRIIKNQGALTHSYIMNRKIAQKLVDSLNVDIPKPEKVYVDFFKDEQHYRGGADNFFMGYVEQYGLYPAITYQQNIGGNREIIPGIV